MCTMQCFLVFISITVGLVNSWDIAITTKDQIEFYTNQTNTSNGGMKFKHLSALAYDAVHNMLLFVDKQNDNASILSYNISTGKYLPLIGRRSNENIQGIAFDPITAKMFWTDSDEKSIYWISLSPRNKSNIYGNLLLRMDHEIPRAIAVDSCRGYIYWTNTNIRNPTIERARLDGSERSVIVETDIHMPVSLALDQRTKMLYWVDDKPGIHYSIESSNLDGTGRKIILKGTDHQPNSLTVSKDYIYWIDWGFKEIWKLPKSAPTNTNPIKLLHFSNEAPFGIVANYQIDDQINGIQECAALANLSQNNSIFNDSQEPILKNLGLFCVHGVMIGPSTCKCSVGYIGDRCETFVCQNVCLNGNCTVSDEGKPICTCPKGFSGGRCEVDICANHCINSEQCSIDMDNKPVCKCLNGYEGKRCEAPKAIATVPITPIQETCNCTKEETVSKMSTSDTDIVSDGVYLETGACDSWDPVRDPILMLLGILCGLLCLACAVLITKILKLNKRPRIKRRIIVNKNVTPLTARPDQCEITIENCCNMNICETPCFEPRNSIRPSLLDAKPGKEEKRNLIANMENQDDMY